MRTTLAFAALLASAVTIVSCGGSSSTTTTPTSPSAPAAVCRNYASQYSTKLTVTNLPDRLLNVACGFTAATFTLACTTTENTGFVSTRSQRYVSATDFVDESRTVGLYLPRGETFTGLSSVVTITSAFDPQNRITQFVQSQTGGSITTTYSAWDSSVRPTAGSFTTNVVGACGSTTPAILAWAYNDVARTFTLTQTAAGSGCNSTSVTTIDGNSNMTSNVTTIGAIVQTTTNTIANTIQVCK